MNALTPSLLSLVLTLRPLHESAERGPWARAAHAIVLRALAEADPALAQAAHEEEGPRPFTVSNLIGVSRSKPLSPERTVFLRFTALSAPVAGALLAAVAHGALAIGQTLQLAESTLRVEAAASNPAAHPWAASTTYESLAASRLLGQTPPGARITLRFNSPVTFRSHGLHVPVPLSALVFGSLLARWNAFAPVALPDETRRYAEECLALAAFELRTRAVPFKDGGLRVGATGYARYAAINADRYWLSVMHLLADYALFSGAGAGTTMGLGQCRRSNEGEE